MSTEMIENKIQQQWENNPVLLYMKGIPDMPACGFSAQVVGVLKALNTEFAYVNILDNPELRSTLKILSEWPTYPQLYIKGELVGGCDIIMALYESGELAKLLSTADSIKETAEFYEAV